MRTHPSLSGTSVHALAIALVAATMLAALGCAGTSRDVSPGDPLVRAARLVDRRIPAHKADILPTGDVIKRWRSDAPWEIRSQAGEVIRRMYAPDGTASSATHDGPIITVIHDPQRGTIYEAHFLQRTGKVFDLPVTLHFFATRDAPTALFTLSFTDAALRHCQEGRVSRGGIKNPAIPRALLESADWVAVSWESVPYSGC